MSDSSFTGRILRYIDQLEAGHLAKLTVLELAKQLEIERSLLYRRFVKELGVTPGTFLVNVRRRSFESKQKRRSLSCQVSSYIDALPFECLAALTVESLAEKFAISASYLTRIFKKERGTSLSQYIFTAKIERSAELLRSNLDIKINDVARSLGFQLPELYSRAFEQIKGVTPNQYKSASA